MVRPNTVPRRYALSNSTGHRFVQPFLKSRSATRRWSESPVVWTRSASFWNAFSVWTDENNGYERRVLSIPGDPGWAARLSSDDLRVLSPLIYTHINPYGRFEVDLARRIDFERKAA